MLDGLATYDTRLGRRRCRGARASAFCRGSMRWSVAIFNLPITRPPTSGIVARANYCPSEEAVKRNLVAVCRSSRLRFELTGIEPAAAFGVVRRGAYLAGGFAPEPPEVAGSIRQPCGRWTTLVRLLPSTPWSRREESHRGRSLAPREAQRSEGTRRAIEAASGRVARRCVSRSRASEADVLVGAAGIEPARLAALGTVRRRPLGGGRTAPPVPPTGSTVRSSDRRLRARRRKGTRR